MLRKSPASNTWAAVFKNVDFPRALLKLQNFAFFLN